MQESNWIYIGVTTRYKRLGSANVNIIAWCVFIIVLSISPLTTEGKDDAF